MLESSLLLKIANFVQPKQKLVLLQIVSSIILKAELEQVWKIKPHIMSLFGIVSNYDDNFCILIECHVLFS
jgi:hypothetical protein